MKSGVGRCQEFEDMRDSVAIRGDEVYLWMILT